MSYNNYNIIKNMFDIQVIGIKYTSRNQYGDFLWMSQQHKYSNSLFIFNDNEEHHNTSFSGGGNAVMRMFNRHSTMDIPLSAGIPTGTLDSGGYDKFTPEVKKTIDDAFDEIIELIITHNYSTIYFSSEFDGRLGTSIFAVNLKVIDYITSKIYNLSSNPIQIVKLLSNDVYDEEFNFTDDVDTDDNTDDEDDVDKSSTPE